MTKSIVNSFLVLTFFFFHSILLRPTHQAQDFLQRAHGQHGRLLARKGHKNFREARSRRRRRFDRKRRHHGPGAHGGRDPNRHGRRHRRREHNLAGSDIVSISCIESRLPYALLAQKEIKTTDQLKGKRLAISRFGSASDLGTNLILQRFGLDADKDITILQIGGTSTRLSALTKRSVDATILTPEFFNLAKKAGFTILADPTQYEIPFPPA